MFLEAIKELKNHSIPFKVDIVGNSGDVLIEEAKSYVKREGLEGKVVVQGPKYGEQKEAILAESEVLVFPTSHEAFGLVIIEAMAKGLAVISTNTGAIPEIVENNINGKIIEPTPKAIKNAMQEFLEMDKKVLEAIKKRNIEKFKEKYSSVVFEQNFVSIINTILQKQKND